MVVAEAPTSSIAEEKDSSTVAKPIVGIIYPPPEVRNIVDKTANFVARNGPEFEAKIRQNEISNAKFNFLNPTDPYHAYYQHKIKESKEGKNEPIMTVKLPSSIQQTQEKIKQQVQMEVPTEPPPEFEFIIDPPSISPIEIDIVKLTAQFVARNGRHFLTQLMNREQRNSQFDFLRPQHNHFHYFTKLVEQYTKILIPPKDLKEKLMLESESVHAVMAQLKKRADWTRHVERQTAKEEEAREKERIAYGQVDWHDFVIVETVDFLPHETLGLPPPVTPDTVGARILQQARLDKMGIKSMAELTLKEKSNEAVQKEPIESSSEPVSEIGEVTSAPATTTPAVVVDTTANMEVEDMEESGSEDEEEAAFIAAAAPRAIDQPAAFPPQKEDVLIRKDYNPKEIKALQSVQTQDSQFMVSPITGERIPLSKMKDHMRFNLLDPRWVEDHDKRLKEKAEDDEIFATGGAMDSSLKLFSQRRTDIFGAGDEETVIGKKIGEEKDPVQEPTLWDGHSSSVDSTTRKMQSNITIDDQIAAIHRAKGLTQDSEKEKIGPQLLNTPASTTTPASTAPALAATQVQPKVGLPMPLVMPIARPLAPTYISARPIIQAPVMLPVNPNANLAAVAIAAHARAAAAAASTFSAPPQMHEAEDEPQSKKARGNAPENELIPEDKFLEEAGSNTQVSINLIVPKDDSRPEWNLNGQILTFSLPLTDQVSVIKAKVLELISLPVGKQKLMFDNMFIKDSNSLAFYNMRNSSNVFLTLKERGGRKK